MNLTTIFLDAIYKSNGYVMEKFGDNSALLIPNDKEQYFMPFLVVILVVRDLSELEEVLQEYINIIEEGNLKFYRLDGKHEIKNYLFYLIKSLTNTDCSDFVGYIRKFNIYLRDETFKELYYSQNIGMLDKYNIMARWCEEYYGAETPYTMRYYAEIPGFRFEMPLIRYGISDDNEVYIYAVQRKRIYNNYSSRVKEINSFFNIANSGVKKHRDITPSMLCSLAIFIGMIKSQGINTIKVDGFLTRRYGYFNGVSEDNERDKILHNSVDKFNKLFLRLVEQFDGIEITAYPFDIDSYFHIVLGDNISSNNKLLNELYNIGLSYQRSGDRQLVRSLNLDK